MSHTHNLDQPVISMKASHTFCCAEVMKRSPMHWHLPPLPCLQLCHTSLQYPPPFDHSVHMNTESAIVTFPSNRHFWLADICQTGLETLNFYYTEYQKWNQSYIYIFCGKNTATKLAINVPLYFLAKWQLKVKNFLDGVTLLFHLSKTLTTIQYLLNTRLIIGNE